MSRRVLRDIQGARVQPWVLPLLHSCAVPEQELPRNFVVCYPHDQRRLSYCLCHLWDRSKCPSFPQLLPLNDRLPQLNAALSHMREAVYVDVNQGDVKTVVDFRAPFLSVCGTAVSTDAASLEALQQRHLNRNYRLPFWISNSEATFLLNFPYVKRALSIDHTLFERRSHLFANDAVAVSVLDGGASKRVVNLEELTRKDMDFETTIRYCFYFFRLFEPINVATRQPFDKYVTNRIRLESVMSKCWCSIWGTAEDYAAAGIPLRDDPLDLVAVDLFGNELTLISAMGTVSPQDCFSQVYPSKAIFE